MATIQWRPEVNALTVPQSYNIRYLPREDFLADKWWRGPDHDNTPEGNRKYQEFYAGQG